jgi:hypothetical protein
MAESDTVTLQLDCMSDIQCMMYDMNDVFELCVCVCVPAVSSKRIGSC